MKPNVYVVGRDGSVEDLFEERGYEVFAGDLPGENVLKMLDLVVFTGGCDIDPAYYNEENKGSYLSGYSRQRDKREFEIYEKVKHLPKAGICRGGQLFNIANGGSMVQDIPDHEGSSHPIMDKNRGSWVVNSCHHQQMIPTDEAEIIAVSPDGVPEIIFYRDRRDFCFQAHPEWGHKMTTDIFFYYVNSLLIGA